MVRLNAIKFVSVLSMISPAVGFSSFFSSSESDDEPEPDSLPEPSVSSESDASLPRISLLNPLYFSSFTSYWSSNLKASRKIYIHKFNFFISQEKSTKYSLSISSGEVASSNISRWVN